MKCSICRGKRFRYLYTYYRGGGIYECLICKNAYTYPVPRVDYLNNEFFSNAKEDEKAYERYSLGLACYLAKFINKGRAIDIGSGAGKLVEILKRRGFAVEGVEASEKAYKYSKAKGIKIIRGDFIKLGLPRNYYDLAIMSHVLEHIKDPGIVLKKVNHILRKGGYILLSQTNYKGFLPFIYKGFWEGWQCQEHISHFSPGGIRLLLEKYGFRLVNIRLLPLGYRLRLSFRNKSDTANSFYNSISYLISLICKTGLAWGDQMYILARKK